MNKTLLLTKTIYSTFYLSIMFILNTLFNNFAITRNLN